MPDKLKGFAGHSYMNVRERQALLDYIQPGDTVIEIGTADGATIAWVASRKLESEFLCIDTFPGPDHDVAGQIGNREKWDANRQPNMALFVGTAAAYAGTDGHKVAQVAIIDGEHTLEAVAADLRAVRALVEPGGLVLCHDCYGRTNGVRQAVEARVKAGDFTYAIDDRVGSIAVLRLLKDETMMQRLKAVGYV